MFNGHPGFEYPGNGVPPCHPLLVFTPDGEGGLNLSISARSNDAIFGTSLDLMRYSALLHYVCNQVGMKPKKLICPSANTHIYAQNVTGACEMAFHREPVEELPKLVTEPGGKFRVENYLPHPPIKFTLVE